MFRSNVSGKSKSSEVLEVDIQLCLLDNKGTASTEVPALDAPPNIKDEKKCYEPKLWIALGRAFGWTFLVAAFFKLIHDILLFVSPLLLKYAISLPILNKFSLLFSPYVLLTCR